MILTAALLTFLIGLTVGTRNAPPHRYKASTCRKCGYELAGLAAAAPCPECAEPDPATRYPTARRERIPERMPMLKTAAIVWVVFVVIGEFITPSIVNLSWQFQFGPFNGPGLWGTTGTWLRIGASERYDPTPVLIAGAFLPLLACLRGRRLALTAMILLMTGALLLHIANWTINWWLFARGYIAQPW